MRRYVPLDESFDLISSDLNFARYYIRAEPPLQYRRRVADV